MQASVVLHQSFDTVGLDGPTARDVYGLQARQPDDCIDEGCVLHVDTSETQVFEVGSHATNLVDEVVVEPIMVVQVKLGDAAVQGFFQLFLRDDGARHSI